MKRSDVALKIIKKNELIKKLRAELFDLAGQYLKMSDKRSQYKEIVEDVLISRRPKKYEKRLVGRRYWKEQFLDEATGNYITIDRQEVITEAGKWLINPVHYVIN